MTCPYSAYILLITLFSCPCCATPRNNVEAVSSSFINFVLERICNSPLLYFSGVNDKLITGFAFIFV